MARFDDTSLGHSALSRDGRWLAYTVGGEQDRQVWLRRTDGSGEPERVPLLQAVFHAHILALTSDGGMMAVQRNRTQKDIFLVEGF